MLSRQGYRLCLAANCLSFYCEPIRRLDLGNTSLSHPLFLLVECWFDSFNMHDFVARIYTMVKNQQLEL